MANQTLPRLPISGRPRFGLLIRRVVPASIPSRYGDRTAPCRDLSLNLLGRVRPTGSRSGRGIGAVIERGYIINRFLPQLIPGFSQNPRAHLQFAAGGTDMQKQNKIRDGIWLDPG